MNPIVNDSGIKNYAEKMEEAKYFLSEVQRNRINNMVKKSAWGIAHVLEEARREISQDIEISFTSNGYFHVNVNGTGYMALSKKDINEILARLDLAVSLVRESKKVRA